MKPSLSGLLTVKILETNQLNFYREFVKLSLVLIADYQHELEACSGRPKFSKFRMRFCAGGDGGREGDLIQKHF